VTGARFLTLTRVHALCVPEALSMVRVKICTTAMLLSAVSGGRGERQLKAGGTATSASAPRRLRLPIRRGAYPRHDSRLCRREEQPLHQQLSQRAVR
jgi:hypothetical protein